MVRPGQQAALGKGLAQQVVERFDRGAVWEGSRASRALSSGLSSMGAWVGLTQYESKSGRWTSGEASRTMR